MVTDTDCITESWFDNYVIEYNDALLNDNGNYTHFLINWAGDGGEVWISEYCAKMKAG